jgi:hypothetical protein
MSDEELVSDLASKVSRGEITFDKVRPHLEQLGIEEARVKQLVRRVDDEVQAKLVAGSTRSSVDTIIRIGIALIVVGGVIILGSSAGFFSVESQYLGVTGYGPLVAGIVMAFVGIRRKSTKNTGPGSDTLKRSFRVRDHKKE